ncbi:hypothetical protein POX_f07332 [Penicillium oxalicum]|uniref:hypothetical protein n=1 Tax=Penicillium oxalicum TaxID=69781 RepID=UPI0020B756AF|nr:hypothetical protein POX_f07332 [Penicillium oxalicum]KAI2786981.1 hypothetical protein POX_f07332 [Penicillium oxalicum]
MSTNNLALNGDETMRQAVDQFRTRMAAANRQFVQNRISEIDARGLTDEKDRISLMQRWRHFEVLGRDDEVSYIGPDARYKSNKFRQTRELAAIPALLEDDPRPLFALDGIYPPYLCTPEARQIFLDTLQEVFQRQAEAWMAAEGEDPASMTAIPRCEELGYLVKYTHEVEDPDFRHSGIAPFTAGLDLLRARFERPPCIDVAEQRAQYYASVRKDCTWLQKSLENDDDSDLINKANIAAGPDLDLEVRAGVVTGTGYVGDYPRWHSAYLYCRKRPEEDVDGKKLPDEDIPDAPKIQEWGWRVVFMEHEPDMALDQQVLYGRRPRFDSIPEFLDWYASWPDFLDDRELLSLRRYAKGCETDCESDCEDHKL